MRDSVALRRYLQRHTETGLPDCTHTGPRWQNTLVIPAYRESARLLQHLGRLPTGSGKTLVILVLNRPDSDPDPGANASLRAAVHKLAPDTGRHGDTRIYPLNPHTDLYVHDMEELRGPVAAAHGVGLARKTGCDIALQWMTAGAISGQWICSTDADATLPQDYFTQLDSAAPAAVAAVFPFRHVPGTEQMYDAATALYELRLHHYVLGLEYAGSPYAHHTLGSCLAVRAGAYAQVRGFPKRAGAEDFYLLNKLAKLGPIAKPQGQCVQIQSRRSARVPFGTGPAVAKIVGEARPTETPLFYHPLCFEALRGLFAALPALTQTPLEELPGLLQAQGLEPSLARASSAALNAMGMAAALAHCRRQGKSDEQFLRQFHQWFDAFRSLKFIHAIRDAGWPQQPLAALAVLEPQLWPAAAPKKTEVEELRDAIHRHWAWIGRTGPEPGPLTDSTGEYH